ncbi:hypothetical protein [Alkalihalobacillus sp. BA299]|uniref:TOTE conflict system archaeo-eukaryotic primase domain-containing protein n=1 Tax=Alkalihalobacillus sp. BA299 TaxID=2815938 RepID=UPI001FFE0290|nr:hypothetical protein [Alkalihalobacillus sp. BA299]
MATLELKILSKTSEKRFEVGMDSFDRMFPNQDLLPKGGFGNLIALPLQKQAKMKGNSVFVSDSFQEYENQWQYLSSIKKIPEKKILQIVTNFSEAESSNKVKEKVENSYLPKEVTIELNQGIQIPKSLLPSKILNELRKLGTLGNPEFFKAQAKRFSTHRIPRMIDCTEINNNMLILPRGLIENVKEIFLKYKISLKILNNQFVGHSIDAKFYGQLTIQQEALVKRETLMKTNETDIQAIYSLLSTNKERNEMIFNDVLQALDEKRSPIVLTERLDHINELYELFKGFAKNIIILSGAMKKKERQQALEKLIKLPDSEERLLIATGKYVGEGFDDSRLDPLFLTMPISWKGTLQQYVGRLHRDHNDKNEVKVFDYVNSNVDVLQKMFEKRLKGYKNIGYSLYGENKEKSQQIYLF